VSRQLALPLELLADLLDRQPPRMPKIGPAFADQADRKNEIAVGRWQTFVGYENRFVLLVDEFRSRTTALHRLSLTASRPLRGEGRTYHARVGRGKVAVHLLGDYDTEKRAKALTLSMRVAHGRFLVALTRDASAKVRVVHGWAVEVRTGRRTHHVMHGNRSRKVRPLGPIQTDACFGVIAWDEKPGVISPHADDSTAHLLQATQVVWGEKKIQSELPVDLQVTGKGA
jgi:hypothetical protein